MKPFGGFLAGDQREPVETPDGPARRFTIVRRAHCAAVSGADVVTATRSSMLAIPEMSQLVLS